MKTPSNYSWKILTIISLIFVAWGLNQIFLVPAQTDHWDWLTYDPEVLEYIKGWSAFRGIWSVTVGVFFALVAATAFRQGEKWAWWAMVYLPVHLIILTIQVYWLFIILVPLLALAIWALWKSRENINIQPLADSNHKIGWIFFTIIGIAILYFAYDNIFVIPALDVNDPDRGWAWLTTEPEIIDYIKYHFRFFGEWVLAFGVLILLTTIMGLRMGTLSAWRILFIVPAMVGVHFFIWPWTAPILIGVILFSGIGLWLSYPKKVIDDEEFSSQ